MDPPPRPAMLRPSNPAAQVSRRVMQVVALLRTTSALHEAVAAMAVVPSNLPSVGCSSRSRPWV